jgi:hypothetical protein
MRTRSAAPSPFMSASSQRSVSHHRRDTGHVARVVEEAEARAGGDEDAAVFRR